jgi:GNAT superfamily N-acetyltransferase
MRTRLSLQSASPAAIVIRPVAPADETALRAFLAGLSMRSLQQRFWSGGPDCSRIAHRLAHGEPGGCGVVAVDRRDAIVGHAECLPIERHLAEVAVVVADDHQGQGIGTALIAELAGQAWAAGITRFLAHVCPENAAMLRVFTHAFGAAVREVGEECRVSFAVRPFARALYTGGVPGH